MEPLQTRHNRRAAPAGPLFILYVIDPLLHAVMWNRMGLTRDQPFKRIGDMIGPPLVGYPP